jgi:hypothetical protein
MGWSGGSYTKGNAGTGGWAGDASSGIGIEAGRHDTQDNDFATGINQCINKDGSNSMTGPFNAGGQNVINAAKVAIGTTTPTELLTAVAAGGAGAALSLRGNGNSAANEFIILQTTDGLQTFVANRANGPLRLWTNNLERMVIANTGEIAIGRNPILNYQLTTQGAGTTSSTNSFLCVDSAGNTAFLVRDDGLISTGAKASSPYNLTTGIGANMYVNSNGELFRSTSSLKYKTDVVDYDKGLAEVLQIQPKYYKATNNGDHVFAGLIAEQLHAIGLSEFVQYAPDESPDAISYGNMTALLIKAIQELNAKVTALENQLSATTVLP